MGKPTLEQCEGSINHFSHKHPLQLHNHSTLPALSYATCAGCHEEASGSMYTCIICNYYLHKKCSEMPQKITHPCDQEHVLCLLKKPVYPEGIFNCDACGKKGGGFCYCCETCGTDFHILCASLPIHFNHQCHIHQLTLSFSPAYPKKSFHCGICQCLGSNMWFYRCISCEFDVHLSCVSALKKNKVHSATPAMTNYMNAQNQMSQQMGQLSMGQTNNQGQAMGMPFNTPKAQMMMNNTVPQNNMMMNTTMPQNNMMVNNTANPTMYGQQQQMTQQMYAQQQQALAQQAMMQKQAMAQNQCNNVQQQMMTQQQLMAQQQMMVQQQMMAQQQQQPGTMLLNNFVNGMATGATEALLQGIIGGGGGGGMMCDPTAFGGGMDGGGGGGGGGGE